MICKTILKAVTTTSYIVLLLLILNTAVFKKFKAMKLFATTILLFVTFICLSNNSKTEKSIFDNIIIEYKDSIVCSKTFSFDLVLHRSDPASIGGFLPDPPGWNFSYPCQW